MNQSSHLKKNESEHVQKNKLLKVKNSILELEKDSKHTPINISSTETDEFEIDKMMKKRAEVKNIWCD